MTAARFIGVGPLSEDTLSPATIDVDLPTDRAAGDVAFIHATAVGFMSSITTPTGWTRKTSLTYASSIFVAYLFYRVLNGSEADTVTLTLVAASGAAAIASAHRGIDTAGGIFDGPAQTGSHAPADSYTFATPLGPTTQSNSRTVVFVDTDPTGGLTTDVTTSYYGGTSQLNRAYVAASPVRRQHRVICDYLDWPLPGNGTITYTLDPAGSPGVYSWISVTLKAADQTSAPIVGSRIELVTQPAPRAIGALLAPAATGAPKLSVQIAKSGDPDDSGSWGSAQWGRAHWGFDALQWYDLTDVSRGVNWTRGASSAGQRAEVGTANVTLENINGELSPWATTGPYATSSAGDYLWGVAEWGVGLWSGGQPSTWVRPGALVRWGVTTLTAGVYEYFPFFTGTIESINEDTSENVDGWITLNLVETTASLAAYNGLATSAVGSGEVLAERIDRLLTRATWAYPAHVTGGIPGATLQATTQAQNALSDVYLTVDSVNCRAVAGSDGSLYVHDITPTSPLAVKTFSNQPAGTEMPFSTAAPYASTDRILNAAVAAKAGGSELTVTDDASIGLFGRLGSGYGFPRDDLIMVDDFTLQTLLQDTINSHSNDYLGVSVITLDADMDATDLYYIMSQYATYGIEYRQPLLVRWVHPSGNELALSLRVDGFTQNITMQGEQAKWTATYQLAAA